MKKYFIEIPNLKLEDIHAIDFVLENMEAVKVYHNEIVEVNLEFDDELVIGGTCIERRVKSGYIKLRIDEKTRRYKDDLLIHDSKWNIIKKPYKQKIEGRLLELCNICYIRVTVKDIYWTEQIDVPYDEECIEDEDDYCEGRIIVCSSAKLDADGNLIVLFGESSEFEPLDYNAETLEGFEKRWKRYTKEELEAICLVKGVRFCRENTKKELIDALASYYRNR
ncbi:MAG: hypothetical protein WC292_02230 [Clostridia bacterium]